MANSNLFINEKFIEKHAPITGILLDSFLEKGFYRIGRHIFTTNYITIDDNYMDVFWLRTNIDAINFSQTANKILKNAAAFKVNILPATITNEAENLYKLYKNSVNFNAAESIFGYLHGDEIHAHFVSAMIEVREGNKLIAAGYFDTGRDCVAGILNFYHPDYKKYSLGKLLMLLKLNYAKTNQIKYYYTGYIALQSVKFDYKLFPDIKAIEVFMPIEEKWIQWNGKENLLANSI